MSALALPLGGVRRCLLPKGVHEEHGELGVSVWDVGVLCAFVCKQGDDLSKREERFVDLLCFFDHHSLTFAFFEPFAAREVDEGDLAVLSEQLAVRLELYP